MTGSLTTHVLDTARGRPAAGLRVDLHRIVGGAGSETRRHIRTVETDADGRTDGPMLAPEEFEPGVYELTFHAGAYLGAGADGAGDGPRFLDAIPIRFGMAEPTHHHVPLLLSPYGYTTYRGS